MTDISITGGTGFLGSYLVRTLADASKHKLSGLTRRVSMLDDPSAVHWTHGDLGSVEDCRRFVESARIIIHLAHSTSPLTSDRDLPADVQLNLLPSMNLLQAIREAGTTPHVIYASSGGATYGPRRRRKPVGELTPCRPLSSYGIVKLAIEQYLHSGADQGWVRSTVLRIGNPYGVLLPMERTQGFIGVALNRIVHGEPVRLIGNPNNVRDYVHLHDVALFVERVLEVKTRYALYNVGSGEGRSVTDILGLLSQLTKLPARVERAAPTDAARALPSWIVLDISRARKELGWTPSVDFYEGLQSLCREALCSVPR
ncbi:MAG: NAD-dependent epimerase/dehydratase family protein [Chloroflexota bacterium]